MMEKGTMTVSSNNLRSSPGDRRRVTTEVHARVPDDAALIIIGQTARADGVEFLLPGRSKKRIVLLCEKGQAQQILHKAARLALVYHRRRLHLIAEVLQENRLAVPGELTKAICSLDAKESLCQVQVPGVGGPESSQQQAQSSRLSESLST